MCEKSFVGIEIEARDVAGKTYPFQQVDGSVPLRHTRDSFLGGIGVGHSGPLAPRDLEFLENLLEHLLLRHGRPLLNPADPRAVRSSDAKREYHARYARACLGDSITPNRARVTDNIAVVKAK